MRVFCSGDPFVLSGFRLDVAPANSLHPVGEVMTMTEEQKRQRARAQYYGPEMIGVIGGVIQRLDAELAAPRPLSACEAAALLSEVMDPLKTVYDRVTRPVSP